MIAYIFANQFTPPPIHLTGEYSKRQLKRQFHQMTLLGTTSFTLVDTEEANRLAKSTIAVKPDGMSIQHHMIFAHGAINYLSNIFNQPISIEWIPEIWHNTIIILIL